MYSCKTYASHKYVFAGACVCVCTCILTRIHIPLIPLHYKFSNTVITCSSLCLIKFKWVFFPTTFFVRPQGAGPLKGVQLSLWTNATSAYPENIHSPSMKTPTRDDWSSVFRWTPVPRHSFTCDSTCKPDGACSRGSGAHFEQSTLHEIAHHGPSPIWTKP